MTSRQRLIEIFPRCVYVYMGEQHKWQKTSGYEKIDVPKFYLKWDGLVSYGT